MTESITPALRNCEIVKRSAIPGEGTLTTRGGSGLCATARNAGRHARTARAALVLGAVSASPGDPASEIAAPARDVVAGSAIVRCAGR